MYEEVDSEGEGAESEESENEESKWSDLTISRRDSNASNSKSQYMHSRKTSFGAKTS